MALLLDTMREVPLAKTEMLPTDDDGQFFACEKCDYKSTQKGHLKRHRQSMHDKFEIKCELCRKILSPNGISRHVLEMHTNPILSCPDCDFVTPVLRLLKNHIISNHQTNKRWNTLHLCTCIKNKPEAR